MNISSLKQLIDYLTSETKKIYIWGIGIYGIPLGRIFNEKSIFWDGYYTNEDPASDDLKTINGKNVIKYNDDSEFETNAIYVLSMRLFEQVRIQLLSIGVPDDNIICINNVDVFSSIGLWGVDIKAISNNIKRFRGIHKGKRCFIIGNGPSLKSEDLEIIKNNQEITFACNGIYRCFDTVNWRPTYYFAIDKYYDYFFNTLNGNLILKKMSNVCDECFLRCGIINTEGGFTNNINIIVPKFSKTQNDFEFSDDLSEGYYMGYTVAYCMMQMAIYMGIDEIYLIGMDNNYIGNGGHSSILKGYSSGNNNYVALWNRAYMAANNYAMKREIKICNATRGGKLEVFPRVDFDSLFKN